MLCWSVRDGHQKRHAHVTFSAKPSPCCLWDGGDYDDGGGGDEAEDAIAVVVMRMAVMWLVVRDYGDYENGE